MKVLEAIRLVQFFLYEKQDLSIGKVCGLFGANGSGKSSFIDAVQIAMLGGNSNHIAFNAQADEGNTTTRSIRTYCLGQYGDAADARVRDTANTYITLIWKDDLTGMPTTMGVCISASATTDGHEVLGRYLLPGADIALGDHLESIDGHERPRTWETFRHALRERAKQLGVGEVEFKDSSRFVRAVMMALRGSGAAPNPDAFTRAFRFGLKMRFDRSVDDIVRYQVLEARPTQIKKFKEVMESFRHLKDLVARVELKIKQAEHVRDQFAGAAAHSRGAVMWDAVIKRADWQGRVVQQTQAEEALVTAMDNLQVAKEKIAQIKIDKETAENNVRHYRSLLEQHSAHRDYGQLQTSINEKRDTSEEVKRDIFSALANIRSALDRAAISPILRPADEVMDAAITAIESFSTDFNDQSPDHLRAALGLALPPLAKAFEAITQERMRLEQKKKDRAEAVAELRENLERVAQGRSPLSGPTRRLQAALRDAGIDGVPVCDLVRVTDPEWQPALEAYLAPHLESILVLGSESEAFDVFVATPNLAGAALVRGSRFDSGPQLEPSSLADLIQGDDSTAVRFLRSHLNGLTPTSSRAVAFARGDSATVDGLVVADEIMQLQPVPLNHLKIGVGDTSARREAILDEIAKMEDQQRRLQNSINAWREHYEQFSGFAASGPIVTQLMSLCQRALAADAAIGSLKLQLSGKADAEYVSLSESLEKWEKAEKKARDAHVDAHTAEALRDREVQDAEREVERITSSVDEMKQRYEAVVADQDFDEAKALQAWRDAVRTHKDDFLTIARQAAPLRDEARRQLEVAIKRGSGKLIEFSVNHRENIPVDIQDDWRKASDWVVRLIQVLTETELHNYMAEMEAAYQTSRATFRADVATRLKEHLDWLDATMERLNKVLKACPLFSNGERYRFLRKLRPEHKELYHFILDVGEWGSQEDLIGAGEMPETFRQLMEEASSGSAAVQRGPLDDYREFFDFDIEIQREGIDGRLLPIGHLSKRVGSGSGGEHRAPLYVIAGAALASAYHLDGGSRDGLCLIVLDEAFNKMDPNNIIATMRYLTDLGLQVFMASPGENLGTLTAFLDRYYDIVRDADNNTVLLEGHDVSEATRRMFRADLLEFNPDIVAQEIETMRSEKANSVVVY